jgi:hypothetical protein
MAWYSRTTVAMRGFLHMPPDCVVECAQSAAQALARQHVDTEAPVVRRDASAFDCHARRCGKAVALLSVRGVYTTPEHPRDSVL